jgi:hypothetical protein
MYDKYNLPLVFLAAAAYLFHLEFINKKDLVTSYKGM